MSSSFCTDGYTDSQEENFLLLDLEAKAEATRQDIAKLNERLKAIGQKPKLRPEASPDSDEVAEFPRPLRAFYDPAHPYRTDGKQKNHVEAIDALPPSLPLK